MPEVKPSPRMLTCKKEIMQYCGNCSEYMFQKYIKAGMPARYEDCRWTSSTKLIDDWWDVYNRVSMSKLIDKIPKEIGDSL